MEWPDWMVLVVGHHDPGWLYMAGGGAGDGPAVTCSFPVHGGKILCIFLQIYVFKTRRLKGLIYLQWSHCELCIGMTDRLVVLL